MVATGLWIAAVFCTGITVVAVYWRPRQTPANRAYVAFRTRIPVITGRVVRRVRTTYKRYADVVGTGVAIVTVERYAGLTYSAHTRLNPVARVVVVAGKVVVALVAHIRATGRPVALVPPTACKTCGLIYYDGTVGAREQATSAGAVPAILLAAFAGLFAIALTVTASKHFEVVESATGL